ncbi:MAG TPA: gfo/Idh/MocA family oxidoreductase [Firmicutes bacterium]|jgi:predicted dehydrogenase|nr:gfo/Idh/MocA family oxidoreductase [Bacillota bacterium]
MKTKFGIIGLGRIAARFATVLNTVAEAELTSVASSDRQRASAFGEKFAAKKIAPSYLDLVTDPDVDAVYIGLTHNFHAEIVKLCLDHGKAVLCEKPFVTNKKDAVELTALAHEKNLLLMEAMWTRCIPTFRKAKGWATSGRIGDVKLIQASFCFNLPFNPEDRLFNPKLAGGSLYDAGVYPIEFTTGILGENPTMVNSVAKMAKTGVDDFVAINMSFECGALASLSCGLTAQTSQDAFIYGTHGHIVVYDFLGSRKCELYDNENHLIERFTEDFTDGFIYQIEHFIDLYRNHKIESERIPHRDSIACAGIFDELTKQWGIKNL